MQTYLKLDFNERSDNTSPLVDSLPDGKFYWRYPQRQSLEKRIAELNQLSPKQVLCTNGGDEAIMILMRLIKEERELILPLPAFSQYTWGVESWKLNAKLIPANQDLSINISTTLSTIQNTSNSVTVITRPNNPTGELIPINDLINIIETAQKNNGWIFLDEAYIEFSEEESVVNSLLSLYDNLIILRTLSKAYGLAGIRLGYILGSEKIINQFTSRCMPFNIPQPSLQIAELALEKNNRKEMQDYCQSIINNRKKIINFLQSINITVMPSEANFILIQLPNNQAQAMRSFLQKNGVLVRAFNENELANCIRITIPYTTEKLLSLLKHTLCPDLICLDMDGVLIDTSDSYDTTIKATVKQLSGKEINQSEIFQLKDAGGFNNDWVLTQALLEKQNIKSNLNEVTEVFQKLYLGENNDGFVANEKPLINNSLVSKINDCQQTNFAIVTGRPFNEAQAGQNFINLEKLELVSLDDVEQPKPSPEGIQKLQKKFSNFSWMCGDNPDDMQAANASNSLAIGIGERSAEILYEAGADIVLKDINELEAWLCPIK
ncbi:aminotransferase class I/II-fold pyridoxal phosphate-dependent enzyme [Aliikangiella sp. IMCC44359]|uniref:aminotransferase class I/II-fold pyridoxal phosphate-dependent enzyme n=1 Tax=Aliikangiella sp. IMCC44359 TaxID=3459125 RepID=UPI00403AF112